MIFVKLLISKEELNFLLKDNFFSWSIKINFFLIVLQLAILLFFWKAIPPQIPFFYSRPWGEEQLAEKKFLFVPPFSLLFLTVIDLYLGSLFFRTEKLLAKIFIFTNLLLAFLFGITFFKILSLTTF